MRQTLAPSIAHTLRRAAAFLVSSATVLSLVSSFPAQPTIFLSQVGIVCATLAALTMFVYFWTIQRGDNIPITEASLSQKAFAVFSVPVALYAQFFTLLPDCLIRGFPRSGRLAVLCAHCSFLPIAGQQHLLMSFVSTTGHQERAI